MRQNQLGGSASELCCQVRLFERAAIQFILADQLPKNLDRANDDRHRLPVAASNCCTLWQGTAKIECTGPSSNCAEPLNKRVCCQSKLCKAAEMTDGQSLLAFVGAATILTITPGLDTALVLRSAAAGGPRRSAFAAIGILLGCLAWGGLASISLGALLAASRLAYTILRWTGAAYLLWLGFSLLIHPRAGFDLNPPGSRDLAPITFLRQGLMTNLLNPKIGVFYITFLPQFVPPGANMMLFTFGLAVVHVLIGALWFAVLIAATVPAAQLLRRPKIVRSMDRIAGAVFVSFGARLAWST